VIKVEKLKKKICLVKVIDVDKNVGVELD